jgi:CTP:molybdopterin cytidylyltransferase MocA
MGRPKALLELHGLTFVRRVVTALSDAGCDPVLVVVAAGDTSVEREALAAGARVVSNPDPGEGPITSLRLAITDLANGVDGIVYLPVDHPLVESRTIATLLEAARASGAELTLPMRGTERGHPAVFRSSLFGELLDPSLEGGARTVVHRHLDAACLVQSDDPGIVTDIDTPERYRRAAAGGTHGGASEPGGP